MIVFFGIVTVIAEQKLVVPIIEFLLNIENFKVQVNEHLSLDHCQFGVTVSRIPERVFCCSSLSLLSVSCALFLTFPFCFMVYQITSVYFITGVLSMVSDNVFVAAVFMAEFTRKLIESCAAQDGVFTREVRKMLRQGLVVPHYIVTVGDCWLLLGVVGDCWRMLATVGDCW